MPVPGWCIFAARLTTVLVDIGIVITAPSFVTYERPICEREQGADRDVRERAHDAALLVWRAANRSSSTRGTRSR